MRDQRINQTKSTKTLGSDSSLNNVQLVRSTRMCIIAAVCTCLMDWSQKTPRTCVCDERAMPLIFMGSQVWRYIALYLLHPSHPFVHHQRLYNAVYAAWDTAQLGPPPVWQPGPRELQAHNITTFLACFKVGTSVIGKYQRTRISRNTRLTSSGSCRPTTSLPLDSLPGDVVRKYTVDYLG